MKITKDKISSAPPVFLPPVESSSVNGFGSPADPPHQEDNKHSEAEEPSSYYGDTKYPGDLIDESPPLDEEKGFHSLGDALPFKTSAQMLAAFDKQVSSGEVTIWPWQKDVSDDLCLPAASYQKPVKYCLIAANGSGKDAFVIAPFAIWFALSKVKSRCIITTSSGQQLTVQTEQYIKGLAQKVNDYFGGAEIFRIRQRYIKCRLTGSEIRMFATDEAGKAEGYHPIEPNAEMAIIVNEGKSVSEEIHQALRRCTGYTHWLESSSPGEPLGFFYKVATDVRMRFEARRVTSYDCPHISEEEREVDRISFGEHSQYYRSKHLALFTSIAGETIISSSVIEELLGTKPEPAFIDWPKRVGLDLAAGGDENAICIALGNRILKEYFCREKDTTLTADWIEERLKENGIPKTHEFIFADDGGVGRAIIDMLAKRGWTIRRILNQSPAIVKRQYGNRGAELWYNAKRIIEERLFDVSALSKITLDQLITRRNKQALTGARIFLESKKEAKANGRPSPDRADAFILSLTGLTIEDYLKEEKKEQPRKAVRGTKEELEEYLDNREFAEKHHNNDGKRIHGSLSAATSYLNN